MGTATCGIIFAIVFLSSDLKDDNEEKNGSKNDARKKDSSRDDIKDKQQQELGLVDKLKEIFYLMKDTDLLKLIPLMMGVGAIHSFTYGDLTKVGFYLQLVEQNHFQNHSDGVLSNTWNISCHRAIFIYIVDNEKRKKSHEIKIIMS